MRRHHLLSTALGAAFLASPALIHPASAERLPVAGFMECAEGAAAAGTGGIVLAQAGGGSGGLSGSTPGSPGVGSAGSTPSITTGSPQQPPQGSALRGVPTTREAAPSPGTLTPVPGATNAPGTLSGPSGTTRPQSGPTGGTSTSRP